jgi:anti-anti-sigma regulatory factor
MAIKKYPLAGTRILFRRSSSFIYGQTKTVSSPAIVWKGKNAMLSTNRNRSAGAAIIVDPAGLLQPGQDLAGLCAKISRLQDQGEDQGVVWVLLDMSGITSLPGPKAGDLVTAGAAVSRAGGDLKLINVDDRLQQFLEATGLTTLFDIFPDRTAGIRSFESATRHPGAGLRSQMYWG